MPEDLGRRLARERPATRSVLGHPDPVAPAAAVERRLGRRADDDDRAFGGDRVAGSQQRHDDEQDAWDEGEESGCRAANRQRVVLVRAVNDDGAAMHRPWPFGATWPIRSGHALVTTTGTATGLP
jgi:hypothetical protein